LLHVRLPQEASHVSPGFVWICDQINTGWNKQRTRNMFSTWYTLTQVLRQNKNHVIPCPNQIDLHQSISNQFNTNPWRITKNIPKYPRHPKAIPFTNHRPSALLKQQGESQVVQAQTRHAAVAQLLPRSHWNCATCPTCPIPKAPPVPSKTRATPMETRSKWRNDEMIWWYLMWLHEDTWRSENLSLNVCCPLRATKDLRKNQRWFQQV
jgi:hypothetical protein